MTAHAGVRARVRHHPWLARTRHLVRTPKGTLLLILAMFVGLSLTLNGLAPRASLGPLTVVPAIPGLATRIGRRLLASMAVALIMDGVILRWRRGRWTFPDGALITALLVGMVSSPFDPWHVAPLATMAGLAGKHLLRRRGVNVLNPAALGLVVSYYAFDSAHNWWGALPDLARSPGWPLAVFMLYLAALVVAPAAFIIDRVNRTPLVLTFLVVYFGLFAAAGFTSEAASVSELFVAPDLHAALFFAAFMVSDPPTSPASWRRQVACGALVAAVACAWFVTTGAASYLPIGLLAGNAVFMGIWPGSRQAVAPASTLRD